MALKDTCKKLKHLLDQINEELPKAEAGNKAAAQRARKTTIAFAKVAKVFRKESVKAGGSKKASTKRKGAAKRKAPKAKKAVAKKAKARKPSTKKRATKRRVARKSK